MELFLCILGAIALIAGIILIVVASKQIKLTNKENDAIKQELSELELKKIETASDIENNNAIILNQKMTMHQMEDVARRSFENYHDVLESQYEEAEREYQESLKLLEDSYANQQTEILNQIQENKDKLDSISATRKAAMQALLKEQEIKEKEQFYSLSLDEIDLHEAKILRSIESELRDPRPIKMIIWSTYYSKRANDLAARVLGGSIIFTGIYKITNKLNGMSYIGQAKDIRERWREHLKCGLGIDTPSNNKLYQAMLKDGVDNFTFELLELCPKDELNEKESFYIQLYQTKESGYNSTAGNKK